MPAINCPHCDGAIESTPDLAGQHVSCPHCGGAFTIPGEATPNSPSTSSSKLIPLIGTGVVAAALFLAIGWVVTSGRDDSSPVAQAPNAQDAPNPEPAKSDPPDAGKGTSGAGEKSAPDKKEETKEQPKPKEKTPAEKRHDERMKSPNFARGYAEGKVLGKAMTQKYFKIKDKQGRKQFYWDVHMQKNKELIAARNAAITRAARSGIHSNNPECKYHEGRFSGFVKGADGIVADHKSIFFGREPKEEDDQDNQQTQTLTITRADYQVEIPQGSTADRQPPPGHDLDSYTTIDFPDGSFLIIRVLEKNETAAKVAEFIETQKKSLTDFEVSNTKGVTSVYGTMNDKGYIYLTWKLLGEKKGFVFIGAFFAENKATAVPSIQAVIPSFKEL